MALAHTLGFSRSGAADHLIAEAAQAFTQDQRFQLSWTQLFHEVDEARAQGHSITPVITGPLTYLWQGDVQETGFDKLELLERLLPVYGETFAMLAEKGVEWVQIDEPVLCHDLPQAWKNAFERAYHTLQYSPLKKLIATPSADLGGNLGLTATLPVQGLHVERVSSFEQLSAILDRLPIYKVLSLADVSGVAPVSCEAEHAQNLLDEAQVRFGENLWVTAPGSQLQYSIKRSYEGHGVSPITV
jgi:5-methyltetrahydropteroyltriglutamate--homocysteine methyltransferase